MTTEQTDKAIETGNAETQKNSLVLAYLTRKEVAQLLNRTLRRIDQLAQAGILQRVRIKGHKNGIGFLTEDVQKLLTVEPKDSETKD